MLSRSEKHFKAREWHKSSYFHIALCGDKVKKEESTSSLKYTGCLLCLRLLMMKKEQELEDLKLKMESFE